MPITELNVEGYRSIRSVRLRLQRINVLVGPNGCGKTNLYRTVFLLWAAAQGQLARSIVDEGGMPSVVWAGERRRNAPVRMSIGVTLDQLSYRLSCGLPVPTVGTGAPSMFNRDPEVKEETVEFLDGRSRVPLLERGISSVSARDADGRRITYPMALDKSESVLSQIREPHRFPQMSALREELFRWRFYHQFRTDAESPLRQPQVGIRTPVLSHDGRDLAAALQTIIEIGNYPALEEAIRDAFGRAELEILCNEAQFSFQLKMQEFRRPFDARELSDGTLRYLCLLAVLLSPRPPAVLALNEPETSLHPDLMEPLARLIVRAAKESQLWITTHSRALADAICRDSGVRPVMLEKVKGETRIAGQGLIDEE